MKKRMKMMIPVMAAVLASMMMFSGCAGNTSPSAKTKTNATKSESSEKVSGGYTEQESLTAEDQELFDAVMKTVDNGKTYEAVSVETQVVAGTNYRFTVNITENGKQTEGVVVIFQPLPGQGDAEFVSEE